LSAEAFSAESHFMYKPINIKYEAAAAAAAKP